MLRVWVTPSAEHSTLTPTSHQQGVASIPRLSLVLRGGRDGMAHLAQSQRWPRHMFLFVTHCETLRAYTIFTFRAGIAARSTYVRTQTCVFLYSVHTIIYEYKRRCSNPSVKQRAALVNSLIPKAKSATIGSFSRSFDPGLGLGGFGTSALGANSYTHVAGSHVSPSTTSDVLATLTSTSQVKIGSRGRMFIFRTDSDASAARATSE